MVSATLILSAKLSAILCASIYDWSSVISLLISSYASLWGSYALSFVAESLRRKALFWLSRPLPPHVYRKKAPTAGLQDRNSLKVDRTTKEVINKRAMIAIYWCFPLVVEWEKSFIWWIFKANRETFPALFSGWCFWPLWFFTPFGDDELLNHTLNRNANNSDAFSLKEQSVKCLFVKCHHNINPSTKVNVKL